MMGWRVKLARWACFGRLMDEDILLEYTGTRVRTRSSDFTADDAEWEVTAWSNHTW